jgi:hypothetical protein
LCIGCGKCVSVFNDIKQTFTSIHLV